MTPAQKAAADTRIAEIVAALPSPEQIAADEADPTFLPRLIELLTPPPCAAVPRARPGAA